METFTRWVQASSGWQNLCYPFTGSARFSVRRLWGLGAAVFVFLLLSYYSTLGRSSTPRKLDYPTSVSPYITSSEPRYTISNTPILLVTAFFPLPNSKHSPDEYAAWLRLFLSQIQTPMVIFTSPAFSSTVENLRGTLPAIVDTNFTSPFDVPPLRGLKEAYTQQYKNLDPEKKRHNPDLYATWNAKAWLLQHAATTYGTNHTKWFFWNDAGALRETHAFSEWPDVARIHAAWEEGRKATRLEDAFFIPIWDAPTSTQKTRNWSVKDGPLDLYMMSEGSMFGGQLPAVKWWSSAFYGMHDSYLAQNKFVGKDQNLFNSILFSIPDRVITVWPRDPSRRSPMDRECTWDPWYYYFFWLASEEEQAAMKRHMAQEFENLSWHVRFLSWLGFRVGTAGRGECKVAKAWRFDDLLKETVGRG